MTTAAIGARGEGGGKRMGMGGGRRVEEGNLIHNSVPWSLTETVARYEWSRHSLSACRCLLCASQCLVRGGVGGGGG